MTNPRRVLVPVILSAFFLTTMVVTLGVSAVHARARLVSPRLGAPLCYQSSAATTGGGGQPVADTWDPTLVTVWVGTDPAETPVPAGWLVQTAWRVGLSTARLQNATPVPCCVSRVELGTNPAVVHGPGDSGPLSANAVEIVIQFPRDLQPGLYNLHVAYQRELRPAGGMVTPGAHLGPEGSASTGGAPFQLVEPNCVYASGPDDARAGDAPSATALSVIHITDVHTGLDADGNWYNEPEMTALGRELGIWAPDLVVATGDITNSPDDRPGEYQTAYEWLLGLGLPVVLTPGNHDQGNLGWWPYYFGPLTTATRCLGLNVVGFDSALPPRAQKVEWITSQVRAAAARDEALFLACHHPMVDLFKREISGSSSALVDTLLLYNACGVLTGHNHYNLVVDARVALPLYQQHADITPATEIPPIVGPTVPAVTGPKLVITTSAAKGPRDKIARYWPEYQAYFGYRRLTLARNQVVNYTYDFDGDGARDPSYSQPLFNLSGHEVVVHDAAREPVVVHRTITNHLVEGIPRARVEFVVPRSSATREWIPGPAGVTTRAHHVNATHEYFDCRVAIPPRTNVTVSVALQPLIPLQALAAGRALA